MTLNPLAIGFSLGAMTLDVIVPRPKLVPLVATDALALEASAGSAPLELVVGEPAADRPPARLVAVA